MAPSPFPRLTRLERHALNQLLWARKVVREAPAERLQLAEQLERLGKGSRSRTAQSDDTAKASAPMPMPDSPFTVSAATWEGWLPPRKEQQRKGDE